MSRQSIATVIKKKKKRTFYFIFFKKKLKTCCLNARLAHHMPHETWIGHHVELLDTALTYVTMMTDE